MPVPENVPDQNPYGPQVSFQSQNVLPPSAIYIGPNDVIRVSIAVPTLTGVVLTVTWRILRPDGVLMSNSDQFQQGAVLGFQAFLIPPQEGFLLSMAVSSTAVSRGQCFVRVFVQQGQGAQTPILSHLFLQGYASVSDFISFPQSPIQSSLDGRGWLRDVTASAGPGLNVVFTVPASTHWLIRAVQMSLVTSGVAGQRVALIQLVDPSATQTLQVPAAAAVGPTTSTTYAFAPGNSALAVQGFQSSGFPAELFVSPGWSIVLTCSNKDVADQIGSAVITLEEFVGL